MRRFAILPVLMAPRPPPTWRRPRRRRRTTASTSGSSPAPVSRPPWPTSWRPWPTPTPVLIGETHTDPVGHWVEAELFRLAVERFQAGAGGGAPPARGPLHGDVRAGRPSTSWTSTSRGSSPRASSWPAPGPWDRLRGGLQGPWWSWPRSEGLPVIAANAPPPLREPGVPPWAGSPFRPGAPGPAASSPPLPYPQPTEGVPGRVERAHEQHEHGGSVPGPRSPWRRWRRPPPMR